MVGIEEFGGEIGEGLIVQLKLTLQCPVRDPAALAEEHQNLIEHGIEVHCHSSFVNPLVVPAILDPAFAGWDDELSITRQASLQSCRQRRESAGQ